MLNRNMKAILKPGINASNCAGLGFVLINQFGSGIEMSSTDQINNCLGNMEIIVGAGTTAATDMDLQLEQEISTLSVVSKQNNNAASRAGDRTYAKNFISNYTKTYKNETANPITVTEIGLHTNVPGYSNDYLLVREVLNEPKVIEPGKSCTFAITIG